MGEVLRLRREVCACGWPLPKDKELHVDEEDREIAQKGRIELRYRCPVCGRGCASMMLGEDLL